MIVAMAAHDVAVADHLADFNAAQVVRHIRTSITADAGIDVRIEI